MNNLEEFQDQDFSNDYRLRSLCSQIPSGENILDIGSGNGAIALFIKDKFKKITLTDFSEYLIERLKEKFLGNNNIKITQLNIQFPNSNLKEKFDIISICDVLEHLNDDIAALKNCKPFLADGGKIFISVPALQFLYGIRDKKYGHFRRYSKKTLTNLISQAGFRVEKIYYWNFLGLAPYFISEKILQKPLKAPLRSQHPGFFSKLIYFIIIIWLRLESIIHPPVGLTLVSIISIK